ncbi:hypothetical protein [Photorhabdus sp. SF281]|uniref:hypothetical protein n=1 Tax=Photorhabdus sp. SF281 TaxID=3459527 RepID=UPI004044F57F
MIINVINATLLAHRSTNALENSQQDIAHLLDLGRNTIKQLEELILMYKRLPSSLSPLYSI